VLWRTPGHRERRPIPRLAVSPEIHGIFVIADTKTQKLYVGKAAGAEGFLGRWRDYAQNGHGGNVSLQALDGVDMTHRQHFQFSILQVFSPNAPAAQVDAAETHFKRALLSRNAGLNAN
jgi:hypothetical protein